jgi:hypothetical protein
MMHSRFVIPYLLELAFGHILSAGSLFLDCSCSYSTFDYGEIMAARRRGHRNRRRT